MKVIKKGKSMAYNSTVGCFCNPICDKLFISFPWIEESNK